jgi:hypothetical protein
MSKGYEERYLMALLSSVLNQKPSSEPLRRLDWEKLFYLADFHHVAHVAYYGIMGLEEEIPRAVRQRFFEKYREAVSRASNLKKGEQKVLAFLERNKISSFVLRYSYMALSYPVEEMCCMEFIEIGVGKKNIEVIGNGLKDMDFEEHQSGEAGSFYYQIPGILVFCFSCDLFFSKPMRKFCRSLLNTFARGKGNGYVQKINPDQYYLFLMCRLTDSYAQGEISLSQILDFWMFYKKYAEVFSWPYIYEKLKKLKIAEFAERFEFLVIRWFGTGAGMEHTEIYDAMESYILTKGVEGREISSGFLPLIKTVADCYERNRRMETYKRTIKWLFPDRNYMETIYPLLESYGILLPFFWLMRLGRYGRRYILLIGKEKFQKYAEKKSFISKIGIRIRDRKLKRNKENKEAEIPK